MQAVDVLMQNQCVVHQITQYLGEVQVKSQSYKSKIIHNSIHRKRDEETLDMEL